MKLFLIILLLLITLVLFIINCFNKDKFFNNKDIKVSIIIFGFAPRSFKYTYKSIQSNIIDILKEKFTIVDIYHHSLISKNNIFNTYNNEKNIIINNNDIYLLKVKKIIAEYQEDIQIPNLFKCKMYKNYLIDKNKYNYDVTKNHYRALYSEYKSVNEFPIYNYDVCIMLSSDSYIKKKININEILNVYYKNIIYTTKFNKATGLANGFYISKPKNLKILCNRIKLFEEYCTKVGGAEDFVEQIIKKNKIKNEFSDMFYYKIRATGEPNWYKNILKN